MKYYVYIIQNTLNLKIYVGKSKKRNHSRFSEHLRLAKLGTSNKDFSVIHAAISKYGYDNFLFQIIEQFEDEKEALDAEMFWIEFFKTDVNRFGNEFGYNLTAGGDGLSKPRSLEVKNKIQKTWLSKMENNDFKVELINRLQNGKLEKGFSRPLNINNKINWPDDMILVSLINASSYKKLAEKLFISAQSIRMRIKRRKLSYLITEKRGK